MTMPLYQSAEIRQFETLAMKNLGLSAAELMLRAGQAAFTAFKEHFPSVKKVAVYCGGGNNGGDGYVFAKLAYQQGLEVSIYSFVSCDELPSPAKEAAQEAGVLDLCWHKLSKNFSKPSAEVIIDALLGIGLKSECRSPLCELIQAINSFGLPVFSLDLPSGLQADSGQVLGACIKATVTLSFIASKLGLSLLDGPDYAGKIIVDDLGLSALAEKIKPSAFFMDEGLERPYLLPRSKNTHKHQFGEVLVLGGNEGMPGAVYLAAQAALRVGAGLVRLGLHPRFASQMLPLLPEALVYGIEKEANLAPLLHAASVLVIGPGLGEDDFAKTLFNQAIHSPLPKVVDAQALRLLSKNAFHANNWVLTPHPGEAASLLDCTTKDIQSDRYAAVKALQKKYGGLVVLKGLGSLVATEEKIYLCPAGNPGMSSAGMGDVLSGVIAGLIAQGLPLHIAAALGVWIHAKAGDKAALQGERGLLASDLMPYLREAVNAAQRPRKSY